MEGNEGEIGEMEGNEGEICIHISSHQDQNINITNINKEIERPCSKSRCVPDML